MRREGWSKARIWGGGRGQRGLVGHESGCGSFSGPADHVARAWVQHVCSHAPLLPLRVASGLAQQTLNVHSDDPRTYLYGLDHSRMPRLMIHFGTPHSGNSGGTDASQLSSHAVGEEDPRVDAVPPRGTKYYDSSHNRYALDGRNPNSYSESSGSWDVTIDLGLLSDLCSAGFVTCPPKTRPGS